MKDVVSIGALSAIPHGTAIVAMLLVTRHSDATGERCWHTAICAVVGAAGLALITCVGGNLLVALLVMSVATAAIFTLQPVFWAIATDYLDGTRAAAGTIAFINSLGPIGGFASPSMLGWAKVTTGSLENGLYLIAALPTVGAALTLRFRKDG